MKPFDFGTKYRYDICLGALKPRFPLLNHNQISIMNTLVVACTSSQWLHVYNARAVHLVASLLGLSAPQSHERRFVTLCTSSGTIIRTVSITPTTKMADICLDSEQFFLNGKYETPLELTSLLWTHVTSGGQLTVMPSKFEGIVDRRLKGHVDRVHSVSWHPDGTKLASGSHDWTVRIWDMTLDESKCIAICKGHSASVNIVQWNSSGTKLASSSWDKTMRIWDTTSWECLYTLPRQTSYILSISWHLSGNWIASGSYGKTMRIWKLTSTGPKCVHVLEGHTGPIWSVSWNPSNTQLASAHPLDRTIRIWDIGSLTGKCVHVLTDHIDAVVVVQWNPMGTLLASASWDHTIRIWKTDTWNCKTILKGHVGTVYCMSWNAMGTLLASVSPDGTMRIWNTTSWKCLHVLKGDVSGIYAVEWNPHGTFMASASSNGQILIWK